MALIGTSLTAEVYTALYTSQVSDADISVSSTNLQGRTESVLDFNSGRGINSRDIETAFSWPISQGTILYTWQPTFELYPENTYDRATTWIECGGGTGFVQGLICEADTFGATKVFQLEDSDTLTLHAFNEVGAGIAFNGQSVKAFSCVTPFIAHSVRVVTTDGVPWRVWRNDLIFQPFPETTQLWQTELTSLGGDGWQHLRMINLEYISNADITLTFTVDSGNGSIAPVVMTIPSSNGFQAKLKLTPTFNKWKLISFGALSSESMRLFLPGAEFWVREWGSSDEYRKLKPFGGNSSPAAEV